MSKNIHQIFVANPIASNAGTDLMYFGQSPYGAGNDAAMTYTNFSAQFAGNVLTTKGDLYTFSTVNARLAVGSTNGQILQVNSAASTGLSWSTPTYPSSSGTVGKILRSDGTNNIYTTSTFADTYAINTILYNASANTVSGLATVNSASLSTNATGVPTWLALTDGQIVIGSSAGAPLAGTITQGTGISVTNGHNSITIASTTNALTYNDVSGTSQAAAVNNGYIISNAGQTTVTLPATAAEGSVIAVQGKGAAGWILTANTGQVIHLGSSASSSAGTLTSTNQWDAVEVVCVTANTTWAVKSVIGNLTVA
jgi:hypothetical protein